MEFHAAERLQEIYDAYWAGAYRDDEMQATLEEVLQCLAYFIKED